MIVRRTRGEPAPRTPPSVVRRRSTVKSTRVGKPVYVVDWGKTPEQLFQLYLMSSYLYYQLNRQVITDSDYDRICVLLEKEWPRLRHQHKYLVTVGDLRATTGFAIRRYPGMVVHGAYLLLNNYAER